MSLNFFFFHFFFLIYVLHLFEKWLSMSLFNQLNMFLDSLSGNKGLCGLPPLPECPVFWEHGHLSTKGKIAIGLSCFVFFSVLLLVIYICCIRRGRNDYDFALPQDLMCKYNYKEVQNFKSSPTFFSYPFLYLLKDIIVYYFMVCMFI